MIVAYVTGHGFGHTTRTAEVLRAVRALDPARPLCVVGSSPARLTRRAVGDPLEVREEECDVGLVQRGALVIDEQASLARWREFVHDWEPRVEREARWLRERGARLVMGDVPPLAFAAAARAGLPSVALANFSWDWIYRHLAARQSGMVAAGQWAAAAYSQATLLLRLPFAGDLSAFRRIEDVPLVARRPQVARDVARARLGLGEAAVALWSFGGHALPGFDFGLLGQFPGFRFIVSESGGALPGNVTHVTDADLEALGMGYVDLVAAADVIVTKPGYGIVSDAIGAHTPLAYTERGDFAEYPILVREMARHLPCAHIPIADLMAGRIGSAMERAMRAPWPEPPRLDGAQVAAERILGLAGA